MDENRDAQLHLMEPLDGQSKTISKLQHEEGNFHASNFSELQLPTSLQFFTKYPRHRKSSYALSELLIETKALGSTYEIHSSHTTLNSPHACDRIDNPQG